MREAALLVLVVFTLIASIDGFYFHLFRYRLYARAECRREHLLHTWNAVLFPFTLVPVFAATVTGAWLWAAVALFAATFVIESFDVFTEGDSRRALGGLTPTEYWMHFAMSGLRWGYTALAFASVPLTAWGAPTSFAWIVPGIDDLFSIIPPAIALVGIPVAALHVALAIEGSPRRLMESALRLRPVAA